jgi:hypothetical protein
MRKILKRVAIALSLVISVVCLCIAIPACGSGETSGNKHTITVVYSDGSTVNGHTDGNAYYMDDPTNETYIKVQICIVKPGTDFNNYDETKDLMLCLLPEVLGVDGKYEYTVGNASNGIRALNEGEAYHVVLIGLKDGYTIDQTKTFMTTATDLTITVTTK